MAYTAPSQNQIDFELESYTAPSQNQIDFELGTAAETINAQVAVLDTLPVAASISPGGSSIQADSTSLLLSAVDGQIIESGVIDAVPATLGISGQDAGVDPGDSTVAAEAAVLAAVGVDAVFDALATIQAQEATLGVQAQNAAAVDVGAAIIDAAEAQLHFSTHPYPDIVPGDVSIVTQGARLSMGAQNPDVQAFTFIDADQATIQISSSHPTLDAGPSSFSADVAELSVLGQDSTLSAGAFTIEADAGGMVGDAQNAGFQSVATIEAPTSTVLITGKNPIITVTDVVLDADLATLSMLAQDGAVIARLDPASVSLLASDTEPTSIEADQDMAITLSAQQDTEEQISGHQDTTETLAADQDIAADVDADKTHRIELVGSIND